MAHCASCGTENNTDARFCRTCGKMIDIVPAAAAEPDAVTGLPASSTGTAGSSSAALVIGVVIALVAVAAAAGYYLLLGPGSHQAAKTADVAAPPIVQPANNPAAGPQPAPPAQAQIAEPPVAPPADVAPPSPPEVPPSPAWVGPPQTPRPMPPRPRRNDPGESAFFPEGNPPMERMSPPGVMVDPNADRWMRMRDDMYRCGYEAYCQEDVRQRYCRGYWGRVPDCVRPRGYRPY
jgi:hypothetical protein